MPLNPNNPYDKKTIALIRKSGFKSAKSGFFHTLVSQATRSNERAALASAKNLKDETEGEAFTTIVCCAAACEAIISECIEHQSFIQGCIPLELEEIRKERSALKQWKAFLKYYNEEINLSNQKGYQSIGCLFQLRDNIIHRNARLLKVGEFPEKLSPCITNKTIPPPDGVGTDWIELILTSETSEWALSTTVNWIEANNSYITAFLSH